MPDVAAAGGAALTGPVDRTPILDGGKRSQAEMELPLARVPLVPDRTGRTQDPMDDPVEFGSFSPTAGVC
jgi:hypothetical protein